MDDSNKLFLNVRCHAKEMLDPLQVQHIVRAGHGVRPGNHT